jgi:Spy/CpxP family protein refolding chaperone
MVLGGLVAFGTLATAQDSSSAPEKKGRKGMLSPEQQLQRLTEQLNLTDAQKPKVKAVLEEVDKKRHELRNDTSLDRQQMREKMKAIHEDETKKMKAILTPDQFTKYQEMAEKMKKGGKKKADSSSQ